MKKLILGLGILGFTLSPMIAISQGMGGSGPTPGYESEPKTCIESGIETHRCVINSLASCDVEGQIPC